MPLKSIDTIYIKRRIGSDVYGKSSYGSEESFKGRWEEANNLISTNNGQNIVSNGLIYTDQTVTSQPSIDDLVRRENDTEYKLIIADKISRNGSGTSFLYTYHLE